MVTMPIGRFSQKIQAQDWTKDINYRDQGTGLTHILALAFFAVSVFFVYRSFYGMRIGSE